jgi:hypothetical protein
MVRVPTYVLVPFVFRVNDWFHHTASAKRDRWIGRGGPRHCPSRSPDLNPLEFFLSFKKGAIMLTNEYCTF